MGAKKKQGGGGGGGDHGDTTLKKQEQPLQAVLLADDFIEKSHAFDRSNMLAAATTMAFKPITFGSTSSDDGDGSGNEQQQQQHHPMILNPLNNIPLIDYTMAWLLNECQVQELIIVTTSDLIEQYCQRQHQQQQSRDKTKKKITVIKDTASFLMNQGDVLRELDKRAIIQSDPFLLVHGANVVTNANASIATAITAHKRRHKADNANMMTLCMKQVGMTTATTRSSSSSSAATAADNTVVCYASPNTQQGIEQDLIIGIDPEQENRLLLYDDRVTTDHIKIPCSFLAAHTSCQIYANNIVDCGIDICSPDVLARFSDEFDYRSIRQQFVTNSVAEEEDGLQNKLHVAWLGSEEYCTRVVDFKSYHAISTDLLTRWCYPIVPENYHYLFPTTSSHNNNSHDDDHDDDNKKKKSHRHQPHRYVMKKHYMYHAVCAGSSSSPSSSRNSGASSTSQQTSMTRIGHSCSLHGPGMIGLACTVGDGTVIERSVVGHGCTIGTRVQIRRSHVWDDVVIDADCTIVESVLAQGCHIKRGAVIHRGCIIGPGCVVGSGIELPPFTRLTIHQETNDDDGDDDDWGDDDDDEEDATEEEEEDETEPSPKASDGAVDVVSDKQVVGEDGKGYAWEPSVPVSDDDSDDEDDNNDAMENASNMSPRDVMLAQSIGYDTSTMLLKRFQSQHLAYEDDGLSDAEDDDDDAAMMNNLYEDDGVVTFDQYTPTPTAPDNDGIVGRQKGVDVVAVLKQICLEYEENSSPIENLAIELNSFKFSQNATYGDCTRAAVMAIMEKMKIEPETTDGKLISEFKYYLKHWTPLFRKMCIGLEEEKAVVLGLESCATHTAESATGGETVDDKNAAIVAQVLSTGPSFRFLLQTLHDEEIVREEAILSWAEDRRSDIDNGAGESPRAKLFLLQHVQDFLEWLEEDEEEDDDDEDDDDDEEEGSSDDEE